MLNTNINGNWDIILPEHRAARPEWATIQGWERKRLDSMYEHLTKEDKVFYIGAEEGDMAALVAKWIGNTGDILLVEPNERVWPNIKAIWTANDLKVPKWFSGFASNQTDLKLKEPLDPEKFVAVMDQEWPRSAYGEIIGDHGFKELSDPGEIKEVKIDDLIKWSFRPTAISLDVEGSEWEVLKGAELTLKYYHPKIWLSLHPEFMFRIYGQYGRDLRDWIINLGYTEELLDYQHEVHLYYS